MTKAKTDPIAAVSYVGRQLGLLVMYASLCLIALGVIATFQIIDPAWAVRGHSWAVAVVSLCAVVFTYRAGSIVFLLVLFCEMITNPVERTDKPLLKIGSFEVMPPPKPTAVTKEAAAAPETRTYEPPANNTGAAS